MRLKYSFAFFAALSFCLTFFAQTGKAQKPSPELLAAIPQAEEKLDSADIAQRIAVLDALVVYRRDSDVTETILPFKNLAAADYALVISKIFEKDLTAIDIKIASRTLNRIEFLMRKFRLEEFATNLAGYILKYAPNGMDFPRLGIEYGILDALKFLRAKQFAPQIASLLQPSNRGLYREALSALVELHAKEAVPALLSLLYDKDATQRYYALESLPKVDGAKAVAPHVAKLLADENANNRYWALDALVKLDRHKSYVSQIRQMLAESKTLESKTYALAALVSAGDRQALASAVEASIDADGYKRGEMLRRLIELKAVAAVAPFVEILKDKTIMGGDIGTDANIRASLITWLQNFRAVEAIPVLRDYLRGRSSLLKPAAAQALGALGATEAADDLLKVFYDNLPSPPDNITNRTYDSAEAALALAKTGDKKAWKSLIDAAANPRYPYRSQIIVELNKHLDSALWRAAGEKKFAARANSRQIVSLKELAEIYARESGVPVVLEFEPGRDAAKRKPLAPPYKDTNGYPWAYAPGEVSLLDGLRRMPEIISDGTLPQTFTFIFDDGRVRILSVEKAVEWWRKNILEK